MSRRGIRSPPDCVAIARRRHRQAAAEMPSNGEIHFPSTDVEMLGAFLASGAIIRITFNSLAINTAVARLLRTARCGTLIL